MAHDEPRPLEPFVSRWSRRKLEAREGYAAQVEPAAVLPEPGPQNPLERCAPAPSLPTLESLTAESDFQPFMHSAVDARDRNAAMKVLFSAPRFNAMDGMDVYVGDYGQPDPIPDAMLRELNQFRSLFGVTEENSPDAVAEEAEAAAAGDADMATPESQEATGPAGCNETKI
jgi:hypothetical protein